MSACDSPITELLWNGVLESWQDEEVGSTDEMGWYGLFPHPFDAEDIDRHNEIFLSLGLQHEQGIREHFFNAADVFAAMTAAGFIVEQHSSGAVYSTTYTTNADLQEAWAQIQGMYTLEGCASCLAEAEEYGVGMPVIHEDGCTIAAMEEAA